MLNIVFYANCPVFDGNTPYLDYLGGTESAIVYISEQLALLGNNVSVFNNINSNSCIRNVNYYNLNSFYDYSNKNDIDIVIFVRSFLRNVKAKIVAFWSEDDYDQVFPEVFTQETFQANLVDLIITVSNYHTNNFIEYFNLPYEKFYTTRNGINPDFFRKDIKKEKYRLIYSSTAYRGLEILLDIYPKIRSKFPQTTLHIFASLSVLDEHIYNKCYKQIITEPSIKLHKPVLQPQLAIEMQKSYIFSYPNIFPETSCISALEAQAAGTPVVTSELGALPETIKDNYSGFCIKGNPYSDEYKSLFINKICELFSNEELFNKISNNAKNRIFKEFTWNIIAKEWENKIYQLLNDYNNENKIYESLNGDYEKYWYRIKNIYKFNSLSSKRLSVLKFLLEKVDNKKIYYEILQEICLLSFYLKENTSEKYFLEAINLLTRENINLGKATELSFIYLIEKNINKDLKLSINYCNTGLKYLPNSYLLNLKLGKIFFNINSKFSENILKKCNFLKKEYKNQDEHLLLLTYLGFKNQNEDLKKNYNYLNLYSKCVLNNILKI
ncbi:MAG: hypothetical protein KatS3mg068_0378 [Candidatus Sericytochromatia bacterium]|nr:MAG: hypothetical protein KatS3mg068_0378 [Candidatus Sericytochromatia bacterium]